MVKETEEMRNVRHELELMSAEDPAAQANMMRFVAAIRMMLTGRHYDPNATDDFLIAAGFILKGGSEHLLARAVSFDGRERLYIAFDVDDAAGAPVGIGLFRNQNGEVMCYGLCRLWAPSNNGRAILVPADDGSLGYFSMHRRGKPLGHVRGKPPGDLDAGFQRASARLAKLVNSGEFRDVWRKSYLSMIRSESGGMRSWCTPLAA